MFGGLGHLFKPTLPSHLSDIEGCHTEDSVSVLKTLKNKGSTFLRLFKNGRRTLGPVSAADEFTFKLDYEDNNTPNNTPNNTLRPVVKDEQATSLQGISPTVVAEPMNPLPLSTLTQSNDSDDKPRRRDGFYDNAPTSDDKPKRRDSFHDNALTSDDKLRRRDSWYDNAPTSDDKPKRRDGFYDNAPTSDDKPRRRDGFYDNVLTSDDKPRRRDGFYDNALTSDDKPRRRDSWYDNAPTLSRSNQLTPQSSHSLNHDDKHVALQSLRSWSSATTVPRNPTASRKMPRLVKATGPGSSAALKDPGFLYTYGCTE